MAALTSLADRAPPLWQRVLLGCVLGLAALQIRTLAIETARWILPAPPPPPPAKPRSRRQSLSATAEHRHRPRSGQRRAVPPGSRDDAAAAAAAAAQTLHEAITTDPAAEAPALAHDVVGTLARHRIQHRLRVGLLAALGADAETETGAAGDGSATVSGGVVASPSAPRTVVRTGWRGAAALDPAVMTAGSPRQAHDDDAGDAAAAAASARPATSIAAVPAESVDHAACVALGAILQSGTAGSWDALQGLLSPTAPLDADDADDAGAGTGPAALPRTAAGTAASPTARSPGSGTARRRGATSPGLYAQHAYGSGRLAFSEPLRDDEADGAADANADATMRPSPLSVAVAAADLGAGGPRRGGHAPPNPPALEHHRAPLPVALRAPPPKEHETLLALLYTLAEDQARREGFVHRSITCNHCSASPIRGVRYKCVNCVDFDLCELCEADNHQHYKTHVFLKIRIPIPPLANPRSVLLAPFYPGVDFSAATGVLHAQPGLLLQLARETHFDALEIEAFYEQFRSLATPPPPAVVADHAAHAPASTAAARVPEGLFLSDGVITKEIFGQCLGPLGRERNLITDRIFHFFDARRDGVITFPEFVRGLSVLCKGGFDERLMAAFRGYDLDGNGVISRAELHQMFKAYFYLSMELVRDVVRTMEEGMMDAFDDEAAKPVSSAFSAPIPPGAMSHHDSDDDDNGDDGDDGGDDNDDGGDPDAASHLARAGDRHGEGGGDETGAAVDGTDADGFAAAPGATRSSGPRPARAGPPRAQALKARLARRLQALPSSSRGARVSRPLAAPHGAAPTRYWGSGYHAHPPTGLTPIAAPPTAAAAATGAASGAPAGPGGGGASVDGSDREIHAGALLLGTGASPVPTPTDTTFAAGALPFVPGPSGVPADAAGAANDAARASRGLPPPPLHLDATAAVAGGLPARFPEALSLLHDAAPQSPLVQAVSAALSPQIPFPFPPSFLSGHETAAGALPYADPSEGPIGFALSPPFLSRVQGQISPLTAPRTLNSPLQRAAMGATAAAAAAASPWPRAAAAAAPFDEFPVMEAMSQDAVAEMVDRTFAAAGVGATGSADADGMTFAQFRAVVETDNNLLAWFEALGPIF